MSLPVRHWGVELDETVARSSHARWGWWVEFKGWLSCTVLLRACGAWPARGECTFPRWCAMIAGARFDLPSGERRLAGDLDLPRLGGLHDLVESLQAGRGGFGRNKLGAWLCPARWVKRLEIRSAPCGGIHGRHGEFSVPMNAGCGWRIVHIVAGEPGAPMRPCCGINRRCLDRTKMFFPRLEAPTMWHEGREFFLLRCTR